VDVPYVKDYDAIEGEDPANGRGDSTSQTGGLVACRANGRCVGGAVVAYNSAGIAMLEGAGTLRSCGTSEFPRSFAAKALGRPSFRQLRHGL